MDDRVAVQLLSPRARLPRRETAHAAGYDLAACLEAPLVLAPGKRCLIPTGIALAIPPGMEAQVRPRSGLAIRSGVTALNSPGTIDADYRGEVKVILVNHGEEEFLIEDGMRIAQLVFALVAAPELVPATALGETPRGAGGFGHTGV